MIEIELKARIQDKKSLKDQLDARYQWLATVEKSDIYYRQTGPGPDLRIRSKTGGVCLMTVKHKSIQDGLETNQEVELQVENQSLAVALVTALGFQEIQRKHKHSELYKDPKHSQLSLELNDVESLGCFLELEIVLPDDATQAARNDAQALLKDTLTKLSVSHADIEARPYMQLLRQGLSS